MKLEVQSVGQKTDIRQISFHGGILGGLVPFIVFVCGVIWIALSGAPDEKGFWPVLILAMGIGLLLAKDKKEFSETVIDGMSQRIVMIMIAAWIMASIIGVLMTKTGFVESLIWISSLLELGGVGVVLASFIICCLVSLSTGSSFATILICGPLLYPAGGLLGADLPTLAGAIIGGATFGDFIAPISDTTIASALSQKVSIGPTVRSRIKYIVPAFVIAIIGYCVAASLSKNELVDSSLLQGDPKGLPMLLVPGLIIFLFLKGKHLLHGLMIGLLFGVALGLATGLLPMTELISLDLENFTTKSFVIDGINRAVGISFFTILLMGLVRTLQASGLVDRLVAFAENHSSTTRDGEFWITGTISAAVLLTTHSVVAILTVAEFANRTGEKLEVLGTRRANLLSMASCIFPFLLPYFIPVILMANTTNSGKDFGIDPVAPLQVGMHNFIAWGLFLILIITLFTGWGRKK